MSNTTIISGASQTAGRNSKNSKDNGETWKILTIAGVSGVLFGSVAYAATRSAGSHDVDPEPENPEDHNTVEDTHSEGVAFSTDGQVHVAEGVNDGMSFAQAFAAARQEVGPGGVFVWHGGVYGTYTAQEWNSMSATDHQEYYSHIDYGHLNHDTSNLAEVQQQEQNASTQHVDDNQVAQHTEDQHQNTGEVAQQQQTTQTDDNTDDDDVVPGNGYVEEEPIEEDPSGITIYSVEHDATDNTNVAQLNVNGHDATLVDLDNDQVFDVLVSDFDGDGEITSDDIIDITADNLTIDDIGGFTDGYDGIDDTTDFASLDM